MLNNDQLNLYQVVILSDDYNLSARLQKSLQKKHVQTIGFYYVDDAIEWLKSQTENHKLFVIDYEVNSLSWKETLRVFHKNDLSVDSVILLKSNINISIRETKQLGAMAVFQRNENLYNKLPDMLIKLFSEIQAEKQQPALEQYTDNQNKEKETKEKSNITTTSNNDENVDPDTNLISDKNIINYGNDKQQKQFKKSIEEKVQQDTTALFSTIGNEIRMSVNATVSMVRSFEKTQLSQEQKRLLSSLMITIGNQLSVLNSLLDYSKIETKKSEVVYHNFHVKVMTNEVVTLFKHQAAENNTKLQLKIHENVPEYIYGDKLKIQQILSILISLALNKHKDNIDIEVRVSYERSYNKHLVFSIRSHVRSQKEMPIKANYDDLSAPAYSDTGISMRIAKGFAEIMGGELVINHIPGEERHAHFSIPLLESYLTEVADDRGQEYGQHKRHLKILLAEDDVINQMYLAGFLRSQGWDVETAYNGITVLELFKKDKYDLIILDGQMPGMDGFEAARRIRSTETKEQNVPILAISGFAIPGDKQKFIDAGMNDYLPKPINEDELLRVIGKLTRET